ncbi:MAG: hypothetical protein IT548_06290 [Alphaproteobacteria bacterium]|nr:hypothetical protein [Alphaproteobacteria bacterium]
MDRDGITPEDARDALARVLDSPEFAQATRLSAFLRYVVTEAIEGRGAAVKGYAIAVDVFGRPADFDQNADPIVRVEASRLRRALAQYYQHSGAGDPVWIELPRGGYAPAFTRRAVPEPPSEPAAPQPAVEAEGEPAPGPSLVPLPGLRRFRALVTSGLVIALAALAFLVWNAIDRRGQPTADVRLPSQLDDPQHRPTIAVALIEDLGAAGDDAMLARALTTGIVAALARFREVTVFTLDASVTRPTQGYLLTGGMRRSGNELRLTMQLVDSASGRALWSEAYERVFTAKTLLEMQDDVAGRIATAVAQPYGAVYEHELDLAGQRPPAMDGYGCVMRAYEYWRNLNAADHAKVRDCLEATVAREAGYAAAWYALTFFYLDEYRYGYNVRAGYDPIDRALQAAQRAVSLAATDARAYEALYAAYFFRGDLEGFKRAGADALRLNPYNPEILADFGNRLALSGAWDEGLGLVRKAMTMNPGHPGWYYIPLLLDSYRRGKYQEALSFSERMGMPEFYRTWVMVAMTLGQMGDAQRAAQALARLNALKPDFAGKARDEMRRWGFRDDLVRISIEGLVKAGLVIPAEN